MEGAAAHHVSARLLSVLGEYRAPLSFTSARKFTNAKTNHSTQHSRFKMADKMEGVVMGSGLVDPGKYPVPIET
jgi:hypothetical protein